MKYHPLVAGHAVRQWLGAAALFALVSQAGAGMFDDEEARRAILELRQKFELLRKETDQKITDESKRYAEEVAGLRRSLIDLQNQLDANAAEAARIRGQGEQILRDLSEAQRRQSDAAKATDERLRKLEPLKVTHEGSEFTADPAEKRSFELALASFRKGDFEAAQSGFAELLVRYPQSGYASAALFWLGNAQFVGKDFKAAMATFGRLISQNANYLRIPEAQLAVANCQLELKDTKAARKTLEDLVAQYPKSEAADAAKDRLARLK